MEPDAEIRELLGRERELLANHRATWLTGLPPDERETSDTAFRYDFERGMLRLTVNFQQGRGGARRPWHPMKSRRR
jgi:hypothetical protein